MKPNIRNLPSKPGIYIFKDKNKVEIYVGKSLNIKSRVASYFRLGSLATDPKIRKLLPKIRKVEYILTKSDFEALLLEAELIKKIKPKYNTQLKDDKRYLYITITHNREFPQIATARKKDTKNKLYFGPYPSSRTVKDVLKIIRRIFPFCTQKPTAKRRCFYSHIKLCDPCPAKILKLPAKLQKKEKERYQRNIANIIDLLSGKQDLLIKRLKKQMLQLSKQLKYEEAARIKKQLDKLEYIIKHAHTSIKNYLEEFESTKFKLNFKILTGSKKEISRVEGYDISNIQGKFATGSMVVFVDGEPSKSEYKKFKIKTKNRPNDTIMIKEVITRRLKHKEWTRPDLILVDGGKAQVSAAIGALEKSKLNFPVVGLAKEEEKLIIKNNKRYKEIYLPKKSKTLQLLQAVRDEAHRFAREYHRLLRSKSAIAE